MYPSKQKIPLPERGYRKILAQKAGCSERTVTTALRTNAITSKCEKVRKLYKEMYVNPYLKKIKS